MSDRVASKRDRCENEVSVFSPCTEKYRSTRQLYAARMNDASALERGGDEFGRIDVGTIVLTLA